MPPKIPTLLTKLQQDYPQFAFRQGETFRWSPSEKTVYYASATLNDAPELLHELAHALLDHKSYTQDIELIQIEREAWAHARDNLSSLYGITITEECIQDALDTYRDWLHRRSLCPDCGSNGIHTKTDTYKCLTCRRQWRANSAQFCELRRFRL